MRVVNDWWYFRQDKEHAMRKDVWARKVRFPFEKTSVLDLLQENPNHFKH